MNWDYDLWSRPYIGFVFLIATAAILAIQQLSETSDSLERYKVLAEIGCDRRMIFRSLRRQVLVYFLVPLVLAGLLVGTSIPPFEMLYCHAASFFFS